MRQVLKLLGWVRTVVAGVTLLALALALNALGVDVIPLGIVVGALVLVIWRAPFGAKYRRW